MLKTRHHMLVCLLLAAGTLAVYWPVRTFDFVNYDDPNYVTENPHVQAGLTREGVAWAFNAGHFANWHPLTWLSHMLDCQLFGLNPGAHHLTSLYLHVANTVLLYLVLMGLTNARWQCAFVAALFAVHPLHVESVAWVAERKDVLSTLFGLLTIRAYLSYTKRPSILRGFATAAFLALGLMAKPMLITLPFVLLLLDYWPLGRVVVDGSGFRETLRENRFLLWEKIPLFVLAVLSSGIALFTQREAGTVVAFSEIPLWSRVPHVFVAYAAYVGKAFWPTKLAVYYPHPGRALPMWIALVAAILLALATAAAVWPLRRHRYVAVGWLWYLVTLVPVIGIVQVGHQAMADRYTYVPLIGIFIILAWGVGEMVTRSRYGWVALAYTLGIVLTLLVVCTRQQLDHWRNSVTLFQRAIEVVPNNHVAHNNLGGALKTAGRDDEAAYYFSEAVRIAPNYTDALYNLGSYLGRHGKEGRAIELLSRAVALEPDHVDARLNLGVALVRQGRLDEAIHNFTYVTAVTPDSPEAHSNLGLAFLQKGDYDHAVSALAAAHALEPASPEANQNLAVALIGQGKRTEAILRFSEALRLMPESHPSRDEVEAVLQQLKQGNSTTAANDLSQARPEPNGTTPRSSSTTENIKNDRK